MITHFPQDGSCRPIPDFQHLRTTFRRINSLCFMRYFTVFEKSFRNGAPLYFNGDLFPIYSCSRGQRSVDLTHTKVRPQASGRFKMNSLNELMIGIESSVVSFGSDLCWNHTDCGVVVKDGSDIVCRFSTRFPSRDGLRVIDAIRKSSEGFRVQVSDHGCGRKSVQVFNSTGSLAADVNVAE